MDMHSLPTSSHTHDAQKPASDSFRSGFCALIGRPNAGKSTLINALMGRKVAITSNTPQTTRHRFRAVLDGDTFQLVLVDTPGLHKPIDALGEELNRSALKALESVDVVGFLLDASKPFGSGDRWVADILEHSPAPVVLVVNKSDLVDEAGIHAQIQRASEALACSDVVVVSALEGHNIDAFTQCALRHLPPGPCWFPKGAGTDQPIEVIIAEFIREKILTATFDEVPHAVGVMVEEMEYDKARNFYKIYAIIYVERESQKGIIVGKGGSMIKRIGTQARQDLSHFLAAQIHLDLRVKLRKGWRKDANQIRRFGYGEGA
jgi:GTP-binding protein Era